MQLSIYYFGTPQILKDGQPLDIDRRQAVALLAYLSLTPQPHARAELAELLWPTIELKRGRTYLRGILHLLKKILPPDTLVVDRQTVQFVPNRQIQVDALLFEQRLQQADLVTAVQICRGEFLAGLDVSDPFDVWKQSQAERMRRQMLQAYRQLIQQASAERRIEEAIAYAQQWLVRDPLEEAAHSSLIDLLIQAGRIREAQVQYQQCRDLLARELQVEPSLELQQLLHAANAIPLNKPVVSKQRHNNLPPSLLPFFGRNTEITTVAQQLAQSTTRLVSLIGMGGIGKTTLALQIGRDLAEHYTDGVLFVDLSTEPNSLYDAILHASGQTLFGEASPVEQITRYLYDKQLLLLIDNFETSLGLVDEVADLIGATKACDFLVTSRQRLNLREEWVVSLDGLLEAAAVQLFQERARQVSGFSAENTHAIRQICQLVAHIPLAIELAAAWTRVLSPADIVMEIERSLGFLQTPYHNMNERHISIRAVMRQSWEQLAPYQQQLFGQLSVFAGAFDRAAFAAVTQSQLMVLIDLMDRSLVQRLDGQTFQLNSVLRQYAAEKQRTSPADEAQVTLRHGRYYMRLLAQQASHLLGADPQQAVRVIATNEANILKAWRWAIQHQPAFLRRDCVVALSEYFEIRGRFCEAVALFQISAEKLTDHPQIAHWLGAYQAYHHGRSGDNQLAVAWLETHHQRVDPIDSPSLYAFILWQLGYAKLQAGEFEKAAMQLTRSVELYHQQADFAALARAYNRLGIVNAVRGQYELARDNLNRSIEYSSQAQYVRYRALTLHNLGNVLCTLGEIDAGRTLFEHSLAFSEQFDDLYGVANVTHNLAELALRNEDFVEAKRLYERGHALQVEIGHRYGVLKGLLGMARSVLGLRRFEQAKIHLRACLKLAIETSTQPLIVDALYWMAQASAEQNDWETALEIGSYIQTQDSVREELRQPLQQLIVHSRTQIPSDPTQIEQQGAERTPSHWLPMTYAPFLSLGRRATISA